VQSEESERSVADPVCRRDDYGAKFALWARRPEIFALPGFEGLPRFGTRRFSSYEELNRWKRELLAEIARRGGVRWTK